MIPTSCRISLKSVGWTNARRFGDVWLGLWLWNLLDLDEIIDRHVPQGKETVRPADVVAIEVINRLCAALQRVRPGRALVRLHGPGRPAGRAGRTPSPRIACTAPWIACSSAKEPIETI